MKGYIGNGTVGSLVRCKAMSNGWYQVDRYYKPINFKVLKGIEVSTTKHSLG